MKKLSLLFSVLIILGISIPFISNGQKDQYKPTLFSKVIKKSKHTSAFLSQKRGIQYPHQAMVYTWNSTGNNWDLSNAEKYIYYPDGKNMYTYTLAPDLSDTFGIDCILYDMYGYKTLESTKFKIGPDNWQQFSGYKSTYTYYSTYKLESRTEENWDQNNGKWILYHKAIYTHNGSGLLTYFIDQDWDTLTSTWINTDKYEFIYDGNNKNTEVIEYVWDNKTWQKSARLVVGWI